ncbi:L-alanine-DL-glutamate epimerase-like enolase superfamily enzyme [Paraburkholderia sp. GAS33]|uniref:mandelate racemase/muconate lactonizing enzyme family protein n=1 Tax=Paraburkholderia sp. GAS33 TaxID=3035130 RepID=UPI003D1F39E5
MAKIQRIQFCHVAVPLDALTSFSNRTVHTRHYGLVRVRSTDGAQGLSFLYVGSAAGRLFEGLWQAMYQEALLQGRMGTVMRALSALDTALWDLNARTAGLPLHKFLGGMHAEAVPAYASGGYYMEGKTTQGVADEMASYVDMGFQAMKMKTGRWSPRGEGQRVQAAREAIGPDVQLMLDCNNGKVDTVQATEYMRRIEPFNPYFIEEPFEPDDIESHARLTQLTRGPVATADRHPAAVSGPARRRRRRAASGARPHTRNLPGLSSDCSDEDRDRMEVRRRALAACPPAAQSVSRAARRELECSLARAGLDIPAAQRLSMAAAL